MSQSAKKENIEAKRVERRKRVAFGTYSRQAKQEGIKFPDFESFKSMGPGQINQLFMEKR